MIKYTLLLTVGFVFALPLVLLAEDGSSESHVEMPPPPDTAEFRFMKSLLGNWRGKKRDQSGSDEEVEVSYRLTSGGTAIQETLMPGMPQEMISIYHQNGDTMEMTHYCMLGNQPHLQAQKQARSKTMPSKTMKFEFLGGSNMDPASDPHMHTLILTRIDDESLKQEWTMYQNGEAKMTSVFVLKKVSEG